MAARRVNVVHGHLLAANATSASAMPHRSPITSHVLDTARGRPAANLRIELQAYDGDTKRTPLTGTWSLVSQGVTNDDGRLSAPLIPEGTQFRPGFYRMVFHTQRYFEALGVHEYFYPEVSIVFRISDETQHYHVPLLISPFGYSTYRGS
ncbi:TPA: hypothetical protein N0F65_003159 [Lagenidium giganteum]|uniref:5-hydroxyisourate hydrolase n=1 Tax=Lagenidium giganteum TaxID=4803 RepID=A0AAV2Z9J3_9STRA|nr:TPA: hypothetical protein N0F65_003159 [Lagenidium giganteum]